MSVVLKTSECVAPPKWCTVSFNCPVEMKDRLEELAGQAGWSRGKFLFHLLEKILPDVVVEVPDITAVPIKPQRVRFPGV